MSDHDANLALLEFELTQRRKMNSILKQKQVTITSQFCSETVFQEELLKLKSEIMDKEENLSLLEPGLKQLLEATKPLLTGLELDINNLGEKIKFEDFSDIKLADCLMCLFRQCRARETNSSDIQVVYQGRILEIKKTHEIFRSKLYKNNAEKRTEPGRFVSREIWLRIYQVNRTVGSSRCRW